MINVIRQTNASPRNLNPAARDAELEANMTAPVSVDEVDKFSVGAGLVGNMTEVVELCTEMVGEETGGSKAGALVVALLDISGVDVAVKTGEVVKEIIGAFIKPMGGPLPMLFFCADTPEESPSA